ncbi:molybdenum cofactor synthesis protein cinnamon [Rhodnius prolixus]|uniref:molybdenum cofactor synthesis protein cinnamon n=1 Tax=Rhodnius prolixus TaxID=13249 RepID=UPI003D189550
MEPIRFGILTVSDKCSLGKAVDKSGPNLNKKVNGIVVKEACVPDEINKIEEMLIKWSEEKSRIDIILTTGGTGFGVRDITPEATKNVITKETPAISTAITLTSLQVTPMAMLSRAISGIRNHTLIINLPGSVKGSEECLKAVSPCFQHAVELLRDNQKSIENTHNAVQSISDTSSVSTNNLAARLRKSPWPMISMNDSINIVMNNLIPSDVWTVPLREALGNVIADDILAQDPLPPFRASIKDGYAVRSQDGPGEYKVLGGYSAGNKCELMELTPNTCVRVNTGSMVPASADAVVQVEDTEVKVSDKHGNELCIHILVTVKSGQDIREVGSDILKGETVLQKGDLITSPEMGLLATVGVTKVPVYKLPIVAVLSTGNELVDPDEPLGEGLIRDSNKTTLLSLLKENGFTGLDMGVSKDEPTELMRNLKKCLASSDVVITTGSVSMGDKDYLKSVLKQDFKADIHFGRVNMKPGKPTTFATCIFEDQKKKLLFCLPGNPVSATVTFHLYVLPALKTIAGFKEPFPTEISAKTETELFLDERPEYKRGMLSWNEKDSFPVVRTTGNQISSRLLSWRHANCLLKLPSSKEAGSSLPSNSIVTVLIVARI